MVKALSPSGVGAFFHALEKGGGGSVRTFSPPHHEHINAHRGGKKREVEMKQERFFELQMFADEGHEEGNGPQEEPKKEPEEKTFTQAELDRIVKDRLERERKKFEGYEEFKKAKEELDKINEKDKTELEKAQAELSKAQKEVERLKGEVASRERLRAPRFRVPC